jgi:CBS domain-containing protein
MSPTLPVVEPTATPEAAALALIKKRSRLLVFEGAELVGIITPTDILRAIQKLNRDFEISRVISTRIATVPPETSIEEVVDQMNLKRIGSVIVVERGGAIGIFTERDLIQKVLAPKTKLKTEVRRVMSSPLITHDFGIGGREASEIMVLRGIKRLPLLREGRLAGMVTARDLVEAFAGIP